MAGQSKLVALDDVIRSVSSYLRDDVARVVLALKGLAGASRTTVQRVLRHDDSVDGPRTTGKRAVRKNIAVRRELVKKYALKVKVEKCRRYPVHPSCKSIVRVLGRDNNIQVKRETVRRDLHKADLANFVRPIITYKSSTKRLAFVMAQLLKSKAMLKKICFTDEHYVNVSDHGPLRCWSGRKGGPVPKDVIPRQILRWSNVANVQMWAAVSYNYKSDVVFFPKKKDDGANWKMDGAKYIKNCLTKKNMDEWKRRGLTLMHDGAKAHSAHVVTAWLLKNKIDVLGNWPAESPDLNVIEELWSELNRRIEEYYPRTLDELIDATKKAWASITLAEINKFILDFITKCRKVRDAIREPDDDKLLRKVRTDKGVKRGAHKVKD